MLVTWQTSFPLVVRHKSSPERRTMAVMEVGRRIWIWIVCHLRKSLNIQSTLSIQCRLDIFACGTIPFQRGVHFRKDSSPLIQMALCILVISISLQIHRFCYKVSMVSKASILTTKELSLHEQSQVSTMLPGHAFLLQGLTSLAFPGQTELPFLSLAKENLEPGTSHVLSLLCSPPPHDLEQSVHGPHSVHSERH